MSIEHNYVKVQKNTQTVPINSSCLSGGLANNASQKKNCCYYGCANTNLTHSIHKFPSLNVNVNAVNLKRFEKWVLASGNSQLLLMDPTLVQKKYFVCCEHFSQASYQNFSKKLLKKNAVPDQNLSTFSSQSLIDEYCMNLKKWNENSHDACVFFSDKACAEAFEEDMKTLQFRTCERCNEKTLVFNAKTNFKCVHRSKCWQYSAINNMDPGQVPEELKDLTFIEERLIAKAHPMICAYQVRKHQYAYRGNVICFPQDVQEVASQLELPLVVKDLNSIVNVRYSNSQQNHFYDFQVRREKVRKALLWLKKNNPNYKDVIISETNLNTLPKDGNVGHELLSLTLNKDDEEYFDDESENTENYDIIDKTGVTQVNYCHQDKQIKNKLNWPTIGTEPIDEFNTPGYISCSFPTLFPWGTGDYSRERIEKVTPMNYFKHLMNYEDGRFAKHPTFRFFAYNSWMRWTALNDGNIFVRNNMEFKDMTANQLKDKISENENIMKQIMFQASNLRGSNAYWHTRANELRDMVEQIGLPTFFLTLSCADGHWEDLYRLLSNKDPSQLTEAERRMLIQENPHIVDSFFDCRIQSFIKNVLEKKFKIVDYWYRIEYQHRGSPHLHGIFWVEGAPDVSNLENESDEYIQEVVDYFSKLVEAVNPNIDASDSGLHPCRTSYQNITNFEEDLAQLLCTVQRHTKCSRAYCLRVNKKTKQLQCRFKFPIVDMQDEATLKKGENGEWEFKPARNDPRLNKFNKLIIQLWRANMDIAPVISKKALIAYLSKYISKCEVSSTSLNELFTNIIDATDEDKKAKNVIQRVFMKSCGERDISAQEVCHTLLRLKLYNSGGRAFVCLNMSDKKWTQLNDECEDEEENKTKGRSVLEKYCDRPIRLENNSLWDCAKMFNTTTWKEVKKHNIVRVFPRLKMKEGQEANNELYYRQQVFLHVPWRDESGIKGVDESWEDVYKKHKLEDKVKGVTKLNNELIHADDEFDADDDFDSDDEDLSDDMILSRIGPKIGLPKLDLGKRSVDKNYDWSETYKNYEQYGTISDFETFIDKMKSASKETESSHTNFDTFVLSDDQREVINVIKEQIDHCKNNSKTTDESCEPTRRIIVQGKAGTGKSFLIKYVTNLLVKEFGPNSYLLAAPTGVAAVLINGKTLHSLFRIPKNTQNFKPLQGEQARNLSNTFSTVKFLILDEYSMIGCTTLQMINERCKEATGNIGQDFGGLNVILLGDIRQLPPVKDSPFFSPSPKSNMAKKGKALIRNFQQMYFLTKCHRQQDSQFLSILDRLSEAQSTQEDYKVLTRRFTSEFQANKSEFENALQIFAIKDKVKESNLTKMAELKDEDENYVPVLKISAKHNIADGKKGSADKYEGLERDLYLAKGCKIMLRKNLWVERKLINGSIGTVHDILFSPGQDFPAIVLCEFPDYNGPELIPETKIVPIKPILKSWEEQSDCTRYQFPITLAYGCSIHKSQGMTLDKAVVDIGDKEFSLGLSYVGLSRVKKLNDLLIKPFTQERLMKISKNPNLELRRDFIDYFVKKGKVQP